MSSPGSNHSWLLPELLACVARHLDRKDILQAILVSQAWHAHLVPLLWRSLVLPHRWHFIMADKHSHIGFPDWALFGKYGHLVRSITCDSLQYYGQYLVPACCQLTELEVQDCTKDTLPLLRLNTATLTSIVLTHSLERTKPFPISEFVQAIHDCPFLTRLQLVDIRVEGTLDLKSGGGAAIDRRLRLSAVATPESVAAKATMEADRQETVRLFYETVHRLESLSVTRLDLRLPLNRSTDVFYRLRKLSLVECTSTYREQLQFVSQCQYLTHLKLQLYGRDERLDPEDLDAIGLATCCPRITHLNLAHLKIQDQEIAKLLSHLPNLTHLDAQWTEFAGRSLEYVVSQESRLREQLQSLDLTAAKMASSPLIQTLLCQCSGLKRFRATSINARDMVFGVASGQRTEPLNSWACLRLWELQLSIVGIPAGDRSLQQGVYSQLSKLTELRVLGLGGNNLSTWFRIETLELSLGSGLSELQRLKELRVFNFSYMCHDLGMDEVEYMMRHWKNLSTVIGTIHSYRDAKRDREVSEVGDEPLGTRTRSASGGLDLYLRRRWPLVHFNASTHAVMLPELVPV
ncbi:hypothetical protein EC968_003767 [Mortierella alpina]|nr:hypothetical protein EC968_003767 [Mortierella alpina]